MAVHFSKAIPEIIKATQTKSLLFCLDYDGTLVPIRRDPAAANPSGELIRFLKKAARQASCHVAIISGRALKDLRKKISIRGITLIGSHGLEWNSQNKPSARTIQKMNRLRQRWEKALRCFEGVHFEKKPFSFVLHYRRCLPKHQKEIIRFFLEEQEELLENRLEWTAAHKAFEIFGATRGKKEDVVAALLKKTGSARLIVAGDDVTDYEMLALGADRGWPVTVGFSRAGIKYFARGPGELVRLLSRILSARTK